MLTIELRNSAGSPSRLEVVREVVFGQSRVAVIASTPRPYTASLGFTEGQALELCLALIATLGGASQANAEAIVEAIEAGPAGALGKNTDTDSHERATQERAGTVGSYVEPELPLEVAL